MHIKTIAVAGTLAFATAIGAASAADRFTTLDGVTAATMSAGEMAAVSGQALHDLHIHNGPGLAGSSDPAVLDASDGLDTTGINMQSLSGIGLVTGDASTDVIHYTNHDPI